MSKFELKPGEVSVMVFASKKQSNPKAPTHQIYLEFADGTKISGGLWTKESERAGKFLTGTIRPDDGGWKTKKGGGWEGKDSDNNEVVIAF